MTIPFIHNDRMHWKPRPSRSPARQPPQSDNIDVPGRINSIFPKLSGSASSGHQRSHSHNSNGVPNGTGNDWIKRNEKPKAAALKNGRCMTCHSLVRWPENLLTFRCSICGTVNDLPPNDMARPQWRNHKQSVSDVGVNKSRPPPISVGRLQDIIRRCMAGFLQNQLDGGAPLEYFDSLTVSDERATRNSPHPTVKPLPIPTPQITAELYSPSSYPPKFNDVPPGIPRTPSPSRNPRMKHPQPPSRTPPPPPGQPSGGGGGGGSSRAGDYHSSSSLEADNKGLTPDIFTPENGAQKTRMPSHVFKAAEDYIAFSFSQWDCMMSSFRTQLQPIVPDAVNASNHGPKRRVNRPQHCIDWTQVDAFYAALSTAGLEELNRLFDPPPPPTVKPSKQKSKGKGVAANTVNETTFDSSAFSNDQRARIIDIVEEARNHLQRMVLKATENLLKRPGRRLSRPEDMRVLLIMLANPYIHSATGFASRSRGRDGRKEEDVGRHSVIVKRIFGLMGNANVECHNTLVPWFSEYPEKPFRRLVEICNRFITYRLTRHLERSSSGSPRREAPLITSSTYKDDWQVRAAARCMSLLYHANKMGGAARRRAELERKSDGSYSVQKLENPLLLSERKAADRGLIIPLNEFYNSMVDMVHFRSDFELWESGSTEFTFCQYSFLFTLGTKTQILEYDAQRQMKRAIHEAFFNSIGGGRRTDPYLTLKVRRDCLAEDSLKAVKEATGGDSGANLKKQLRVNFLGEEGIDAGGIRKEWFLLIIKELFDPNNGIFVYDEESRYCYFNPNSLESSELYFDIGVLLGLAIYNSIILDIALPPVVFKKLLAPPLKFGLSKTTDAKSLPMPQVGMSPHSLDDLAVFRPSLAKGLKLLLQYDGDVESAFGLYFGVDTEAYGKFDSVPLCPDGENRPVTNENRKEYVQLYVNYAIDTAVKRQFDPFKRGFIEVLRSNSLDLFEPQEIEHLVRGSDEGLEVDGLRAVAKYSRFRGADPSSDNQAVNWFWKVFEEATPERQRSLLRFITASDRIPALGTSHLVIEIENGGNDIRRYPIARTCFNRLVLYEYESEEILAERLWRAVEESEGFGLK